MTRDEGNHGHRHPDAVAYLEALTEGEAAVRAAADAAGRAAESTVDLVRNLSAHCNDRTVARALNKQGRRTAHGLRFTRDLVFELRRSRGIPAHAAREGQEDGAPLSVAEAARDLGVNEATLYRWIHAGLAPVIDPGVDGAPLRVRMTEGLRARFRPQAPEGFVPVQVAMQRLGVSRQTIWNRVRAGELASCHVTHGNKRGLCVEMAEEEALPLFEAPSAGRQA